MRFAPHRASLPTSCFAPHIALPSPTAAANKLGVVPERRRSHWGWGYEDQRLSPAEVRAAAGGLAAHLGLGNVEVEDPVALEAVMLPAPRIAPPAALAEICENDNHSRASHAWGKSYADVVRGFRGSFEHPPDFVVRPREAREVEQALEWCAGQRVAVIPYGGGTSVVGGVRAEVDPSYNGVVTLDLGALDRVLEVDPVSRAARIQAGASGPALERQLGRHGLTLRHFPQSFELSTLGGWIATRAAGHFATVWTHIEDFVESVSAITPAGEWRSRRLPGSGAGVSPDRMLAGSEGALGVIVEAWVRVQPPPAHRRAAGVRFPDFMQGVECVRALAQSGLNPANCRLIDPREARVTMAGDGEHALLVLGFESADHPMDAAMERALTICREHGGQARERGADGASGATGSGAGSRGGAGAEGAGTSGAGAGAPGTSGAGARAPDTGGAGARAPDTGGAGARAPDTGGAGARAPGTGGAGAGAPGTGGAGARAPGTGGASAADAVGNWREAFLRAPYVRDVLVAIGAISETFETAITWERFPAFHERVTAAAERAMREVGAQPGGVSCRFTHVYPDGPAPYYTVIAKGRRGGELEQWGEIKRAVSDAIIEAGGTITHHHAVGRDHRPWYDRQRPEPFAAALRGAKAAVDPRGIMNPGVLVDPLP
jgi:alkyldihydroxyacetonephosphate synthase